jgi:hypothetical protein
MKKIVIFTILTVLIIFSLQQSAFSEIEGKENRANAAAEAAKSYKREVIENNYEEENSEEEIIEEKAIEESPEIKFKSSQLKKLLPTDTELDEITLRSVWRYVDKQFTLNEQKETESIQGLLRDIGRVYDPIVNRYKVSTIQIEILKYENNNLLKEYWETEKKSNLKKMYDNAYLIGSPDKNIECFFNHTNMGAITICKTNEYVIQAIIFDEYQEHFMYSKLKSGPQKLVLTQDEMSVSIVNKILEKINDGGEHNYHLYKILESNKELKENEFRNNQTEELEKEMDKIKINKENKLMEEKKINKLLGIEKDKKYGIQNFHCMKNDFGLVTITGQFNNNGIKKDKVVLEILFLNYDQNIIFKNKVNLLEIDEFETKRFLGNTKINESFSTCVIKVDN